jgi:hypothetical protein
MVMVMVISIVIGISNFGKVPARADTPSKRCLDFKP